jgi:formamidopyrimidine-DNA glycosylase
MPELPEVETVARGLTPLIGQRWELLTIRRGDLRFPITEERLQSGLGATVTSVGRRAKFVLIRLQRPDGSRAVLRFHLGMSGRLYFAVRSAEWLAHEHLELGFSQSVLRYRDPRRFGRCDLVDEAALVRWSESLAPEPWSAELTPATARARAGRRAIKTALLAGDVVVGVGNIYANEALFRAGIAPQRSAATLTDGEWTRLIGAIQAVLSEAIAAGGTTLRDYVTADGSSGWFQLTLAVYGRTGQPCVRCGHPIVHERLQGRSTWWCRRCQPL